jgi:hyperosmotically inducible periplasmic protein
MLAKTLLFLTVTAAVLAQPGSQSYINREVQHELLMLPYFTVFDNITYQVNGYNVVLSGQVVQPTLKDDAARVVKRIEGVESVENHIEVLPTSPIDDGIRLKMFRAIYGFPALEKYSLGINKPIRIIVKGGHVTLEGVVDSEADKNLVGIRANSVPDVFSVTNNLHVANR